jgi:crotonobetainyl-CoA:carnitine CoA-transferase CaiB-like acyl-CoA transferase
VFSAVIVANGLQGLFFHWRGIAQKPGGLTKNLRYNVEMGPPVFAPLLASMVGGMGILAALLRREDEGR